MSYFRIFIFILISLATTFFLVSKIEGENFEPIKVSIIKREKPVIIFMGGDVMLDRNAKLLIDKNGLDYPFKNIKEKIKESDIAVANLEGVFTDEESIALKNNNILRFTFDPKLISILNDAGFDALSQANNHTNDFGNKGLMTSYNYLKNHNILPFGDYFNEQDQVATFLKDKEKIAFVGFNEFAYKNFDNVLNLISLYKGQSYFVIVMPHWGIEYKDVSSDFQKEWAYKFIDSGADVVVGAHPHVVQTLEFYKGKPIFYSLGNFIFDQYFSKETSEGLVLNFSISESKIKIELLPISIGTSSPIFMNREEKAYFLQSFSDRSVSDEKISEQIKGGLISVPRN